MVGENFEPKMKGSILWVLAGEEASVQRRWCVRQKGEQLLYYRERRNGEYGDSCDVRLKMLLVVFFKKYESWPVK